MTRISSLFLRPGLKGEGVLNILQIHLIAEAK